jgi:hypothetical protein
VWPRQNGENFLHGLTSYSAIKEARTIRAESYVGGNCMSWHGCVILYSYNTTVCVASTVQQIGKVRVTEPMQWPGVSTVTGLMGLYNPDEAGDKNQYIKIWLGHLKVSDFFSLFFSFFSPYQCLTIW